MTVEQLERFEKYYLSDDEISPDDFEFIIANSPEIKRHQKVESYDIRDYYNTYLICPEIDGNKRCFSFSAQHRCIKYEKEKYAVEYLDFKNKPFDPCGDLINHTVKVGKYNYITKSAIEFNFLILLLKWSDSKFNSGEFPVNNRIDAAPILITKEVQEKYGIYVDINSHIPFSVGYAEYNLLDELLVAPTQSICGGLCFYIGDYYVGINKESCNSIADLKSHSIMSPYPELCVFGSPYIKQGQFRDSFSNKKHYAFRKMKHFQILGNKKTLKIYVFDNTIKKETLEITLFSKKDYYSVAAWLIVTLAYYNYSAVEKYIKIRDYWPDCPILNDENIKAKIQWKNSEKKTTNYIKVIKPFYDSIVDAVCEYAKVKMVENSSDNQSLENSFKSECILLTKKILSSAEFIKNGTTLLNGLMNTAYDPTGFDSIINSSSIKSLSCISDLIKTVYAIDIFAIAFEKLDQPIAQAIIHFYTLLGNACIDIGNNTYDRDWFDRWIKAQQNYVDAFENEKDKPEDEDTKDNIHRPVITIASSVTSYSTLQNSTITGTHENHYEVSSSNAREELDSLVGLDSIKKDVVELISLVKVQQMRKNKGLKSVPVTLHLVFTGNPGTGKTTVARILAQLYKEIGVLKKGQLVEVDRADLVAGYVGQTAIKTQEKIKEAMGGILFIDEAYTLAKEGNDFGQEAIDTILKEMEDSRDEFIVIVAGYDKPMQKFINSNPGLKSRFNKYFHFPDYSSDELIEIFKMMIQKYDYSITDDAMESATKKITEMERNKGENFANARDVRNYFEHIITRQATRISSLQDPTNDQILEIINEDV